MSPGDSGFCALMDELAVVRAGEPSPVASVLPRLRELAHVEALVCASPVQSTSGWALERFYADNLPNTSRFRTLVSSYLSRADEAFGWFNPAKPEPDQRNVLLDLRDRIPLPELEASRGYAEVLQPLHLHRHHIVRALVCDGDTLLAWFGVFHPTALDSTQHALISAALPALQRRLVIDRKIESAPLVTAALEAVLEQIAGPAFVVSSTGRIHDVNDAGRTMLETRRGEIATAILAALAGEPSKLPVELIALTAHGAQDHWLAVVRTHGADNRVTHAVARAAARLKLTRRQREVLARVIVGESNAAIGAALKITERAVEQHVTALFDRAAVESRAALVTYVLLG